MTKFYEYARLIRPYGILFLGLTPVFGAICNGKFDFFHLFILFIIGSLAHIFGFVQNDFFDIDIDKKSRYVLKRSLVTGRISENAALCIILISFLLSIMIAAVFLFTLLSLLILLLSFILVTLYNKYCKQIFGMEYVLAVAVFSYGIFGALTVSNHVTGLATIISFVGMMQWLFSVGISANLKDVKYDTKMGVKTTPTILGVRAIKDTLYIPPRFKVYSFGIKIIHIIIVGLPLLLGITSLNVYSLPIPIILFIALCIVIFYLITKIFSTPLSNRNKMLVYEGLQEGFAFLLIPIALMSYLFENIGIIQTILLIATMIIWPLLSLRTFFGKKMIPLE